MRLVIVILALVAVVGSAVGVQYIPDISRWTRVWLGVVVYALGAVLATRAIRYYQHRPPG